MDSEKVFDVPSKELSSPFIKISDTEPCKSTDYRFPTMKLFPLLLDTPTNYEDLQVSPSIYLKEMSYTTEERFKELSRGVRQVLSLPDYPGLVHFKVTPSIILFQNVAAHSTTTLTLAVTNSSRVSRHLKMSCETHPNIRVKYRESAVRKLAAGMTVKFNVEHTPSLPTDYFHKILFTSEDEESFIVPIIALSPRQLLDLPDRILLPITPVKVESKKTLIIRNISCCMAVANFTVERPFIIDPDKIYLGPDEIATVTVTFCTPYLGNWKNKITVIFETGEKVVMTVEGSSELGNVYLSCARVDIPDTYMNMKRQGIVSVHNSTEYVVSFQWHLFKSLEDDHKTLSKLKSLYEEYQEIENNKVAKLVHFDVYDEDIHQIICERITRDNINLATSDSLYFNSKHFNIFPIKGEIWPGGVCNCTVVFSSESIGKFETFTFLEIDGLESRLPLCLSASAIGPKIKLNIDSLDTGEIHLLQVFSAQVIVENVGNIAGSVCFISEAAKPSSTISCSPLCYRLEPGQSRPYLVSVSRSSLGIFTETITFQIDESRINISCVIKGNVIIPPLEYSDSVIDFGTVPLGFEVVKTVRLINPCSQPFGFSINITGYWEEEAVRAWDKKPLPSQPKQFSVYPSDGLIKPYQQLEIKVVGLLNVEDTGRHSLKLSVWDNSMDHLTLNINYSISAVLVRCLTPEVFIDFTFLNYVYEQEIQLINDSDSTSFYTIYSESSNRAIECTIKENDGVILPYGEITVNLCLKIVDPGKHKTRIMMKSFGNVYPLILSIITMNGIHPVLNLEPMELEMGEVVLLVPTKKTFSIANVSPISTEFCIKTVNISGFWSWSENSGVVQGNSKHVIEVVLRLLDPGPIEDTLIVSSPGTSLRLKMTAVGIGCAIITAPCLCPSFNLGHLISSMVHEIDIMIINKSSATHDLMWSTCENLVNWTKAIADENQGDYINIIPYRMTLKPGQMEKVVLTAYCEEEKTVQELYYCVGVSGVKGTSQNSHCRKTLGESLIQATFVNPRLKMSKNEINFCVRVAPDDPFPLSPTDTVKVTPEFNQEIILEIRVKAPFKIVREDGLLLDCMSIHVLNGTPLEVTVMFDTSFKTDCYSWSADDSIHFSYKNHSCKAILPLHGEVQYPNIVLSTHLIDFGGIHKYSESYREIVMKNMSPYDVQYSWEWCDLAVKHFPSFTEITEDKSIGSKSGQRLSELECVQGTTSSSSRSKSISGVKSKSQSHHSSSMFPEEPPDVHSIIREVLNIIISDAQYPEDCDIDEEDRMALRDIAFLLKNNEGLFEKFSSLLIPSKESPSLLPTTHSETQLFMLPNRIIHSAIAYIKRLEGLVIRDETLAGFQDAVVPFLSRFIQKQLLESVVPVMPVVPHNNRPSVSNLVDLTPKWGVLLSGQQQVIGALFKPNENVEVNALAICKIYGGPAEKVSVRGICSEAKYSFSRQIDFGFIPFCELNTLEWKVFNECCINIVFRIIKNLEDVITVEPMDGYLKANSEFCFNVICLPGCPGPVQSTFHIELATLEVAKIEVRGMSVMSQVLLDLPEKENDVPVEMLYQAVASLTHPAFLTPPGPRRPSSTSSSHNSRLHESTSISHSTRSKLTELNGFQLIGYPCCQEDIPSLIDLKLAFERQMMVSCLQGEEKIVKIHALSKSLKRKYFTDCLLAPYQLEFGSVIFDTTVVKTVQVYNYGYLDAQVSLSLYGNEDKLKKHGINFSWSGLCNIEAGGVGSFTVTLNPSSTYYPGCFYNLFLNFILQVGCGGTLPIEMRAYFVQPEITIKSILEFGEIKCGQTKNISLTLSNISTVDAEWTISLRAVRRKTNEYSVASFSDSAPCPFFFDKESGLISPGQSDIIIVSFLPIKQGLYERVLEIKINQSRSMPKCKLRGTALEPYINVNQLVLDFGTVYPYSFIYEQDITVHNPCPFAIQVTLTDFDSETELENRVLRAMCHYYNTNRMQLPLKYFDTNMSPLVIDMYNSMARLGGFLRLTKIHSTTDTLFSDDNVVNKKTKKGGTPAKGGGGKVPSAKGGRRKSHAHSVSKGRRSTISAMSDEKTELDQYLAEKTPSEIDDLVNEYIDWLHNIPENDLLDSELMEKMSLKFDLLDINDDDDSRRQFFSWMEKQFEFEVVDQELKDPYRKGTILIFYGAPFTDYVYLAHNAARQLTLKPITLDSLIIEEAAYTHGPGALAVRELINNAYNLVLEARRAEQAKLDEEAARLLPPQVQPLVEQSKSFPDQDLRSVCSLPTSDKSEGKPESDIIIDPQEDLEMKITAIIDHAAEEARKKAEEAAALAANMAVSMKQKSKNPKEKDKVAKSDKSTASKSTKESSKISKKDLFEESDLKSDTFLDIGMEIIQELICHRMKLDIFDKGIIVDNLTGLFIKNAAKCLEMLLSIAGPTKNIYFVNVNHSYESMNILRKNQKKSEEMRILKSAEDLVNKLKQGSMDKSVALMSRKSCYEALDLYHNTAIQLRNEIIMQRILAEEMAAREAEMSEATFHPRTGASRIKLTRGTSQSRLTSIPSSSSTAKPKSRKSGEDNKKSKTALDKKNKKKKKPEPEPEPEEEVIPPEEIKIIEQFKCYSEDFIKIVCILEKHDRLKIEGDMEQSKRSSLRSAARKGSRSRIYFGAASSVLKMQSPKDKEKPSTSKDPPNGILTCPAIGEEVDSNAGVPLIILNNANITTELNYLAQISGLKSVIPPLVIEPPPRERAKSNHENDLNNKNFWYDKPEIMKREKLCKAFNLENKVTTKEMIRKETNLNRVRPHTSMPALKEFPPRIQPVRRVSPLTHTLVYLNEKRVSVKMFKKKLESDDTELITRKTLSTSGAISWTVSFYPEDLGRWKQDLHLGISGWAKSGVTVRLEGLVELPDILREPEAIFSEVLEDVHDVPKLPCFIKARNVFDFGFVFSYVETPDANHSNSVIKKIKFMNPRKLTAHLHLSLNLNTHFDLEPNQIDLKAGEHRWLLVECNPRLEGTLQDQLFCSILNNPEPLIIQLCCTGVKGQILVKPKDILFDKVLLKHCTTKTIVLSNTCGLPLHWLFKSLDDITHSLTCSLTSGCVKPFGRVLIHFSYKALQVEVLDKPVTLQVYDKGLDDGGVLIQTMYIPVKGESYDVIVNICFPDSETKQLEFGDIKVEVEHTRSFFLENKGHYEINFKIDFEQFPQEVQYSPSDIFSLSLSEGVLPAKSKVPFKVSVSVKCLEELVLDESPMLKVLLFEKSNHVANISIPVSLCSHYTKFRLVPKDEVGFGSVLVGETKVLFLTIENIGHFDFKYVIISKAELDQILDIEMIQNSQVQDASTFKDSQDILSFSAMPDSNNEPDLITLASKTPEPKSKKQQSDKKQIGPFTVHGVSGLIKREASIKIKITCSPNKEANFKEVILIQASELPEAIRYGLPVNLLASGCLPSIDFSNISLMYKEAIIVSDSNKPYETDGFPAVIYSQDSGLLFQNVVVSTSKVINIYLQNTGMVSSTVKTRIQAGGSVRSEYFSVESPVLHIAAYATEIFSLKFSPLSIELSEGVLEMELEIPHSKPVIHRISLSGRGCLPLVELISPIQVKSCVKSDKSVIDMGTCLLEFHLSNILTFRNCGKCQCKFILELTSESDSNCFSLAPLPHCKELITSLDDGKNERLSCGLGPEKEVQLSCVFAPVVPVTCVSSIKVLIVDNPYEQYKILLCGRGHMDNVTLEGLPFLLDPTSSSNLNLKAGKAGKSGGGGPSNYLLDFGQAYVGQPVKQEMKLRNHGDCWLRYTWDLPPQNQQGLTMYPRLGCLPPKSSTMMYAVLLPTVPSRFTKVLVKCNLEKVILIDPCTEWSSHDKLVAWLRHEDKYLKRYDVYCNIAENEDEPVYSEVIKMGELKLQVQVEADKPTIVPDVLKISFPDTLICQGSSSIIRLKNPSRVEARFSYNVTITRAVPSHFEAEPVFSSGKLTGNNLYPNTGQNEDTCTTPSTTSSKCTKKGKSVSLMSGDIQMQNLSTRSELSDLRESVASKKREEYSSCPFIVSPETCILQSGTSCQVEIDFIPMQMFSYSAQVLFTLEGVEENTVSVDIEGTGLTSYCHLEIDNVEFVSEQEYPDRTKAIIIDCIGIPASYNKKFSVINPTDKEYHFEWIKTDRNRTKDGIYEHLCATPSGLINPHKSYDMDFNFFSVEEGKFENLWLLRIPEMDMEQYILFITSVREPSVKFSSPDLTLNPTIAGLAVTGEISLRNEEDVELKFKVDKCSLFSEGRYEKLDVEPASGLLPPLTSFIFRVSLTPKRAGDTNFLVRLQVAKKKEPMLLRVSTCCYSVEALVTLCPEGTSQPVKLITDKKNYISLGHMELKVPKRVVLKIRNTGRAGFYVELTRREVQTQWKRSYLQLDYEAKTGFISPGTMTSLDLIFAATTKASFNNLPMTIKILKGPEYEVLFSGDAAGPEYIFNFSRYEFGPRLIQTSYELGNTAELVFRNEDEVSLEIEKLFKDTDIFKVELEYSVVPPRSALTILVKFYPREMTTYSSDIEFLINGIYSNIINFTGTGVPLKVELVRTKDKLIDFSTVLTGQTVCRSVEVINRSQTSVTIRLVTRLASKDNYLVNVKPKELFLPIDKICKFTLLYTPLKRGTNMTEKIWFECEEHSEVLVVTEGRGVGAEFRLDRDMIPFGLAILGSSNTVKLALINSGDFGARFAWDFSKASECFKVTPKEGYTTPGSILTFELSFTPKSNTPRYIRNQVTCNVENSKAPLSLVLTGSCADVPPPKDFIKFNSPVRQKTIKTFPIFNHTSEKWVIYPTISGDGFTGEAVISILPRSTANYEITYYPTAMAKKKSNHEGSVFLAYPDGQSILYGLKGQANPPESEKQVTWTTSAKKNFVGKLPIKNWLADQSQRFTVQIKGQGEGTKSVNKNLYKIFGNAQIEVAPSATREYDVHFFSYLSTTLNFIVTYTNDADGEYAWLELIITVTEPDVLENYYMETQVRKPVELQLPFYNPMDNKQTLTCDTLGLQISINTPVVLPPKQTSVLTVSYFPVTEEEKRVEYLVIKSTGLGDFNYKLYLTARPALLPPVVNLTASLGRNHAHTFTVTNHTHYDTTFSVQVDSKSLICPKEVKVRAMNSESIIILYEPFSEITEDVILTAASNQAGSFKFPLCLTGTSPVPRGPFDISPGGSLLLSFKNIFHEAKEFIMATESELFTIKIPKRQIKPKQEGEFLVQMVKKDEIVKGDKVKWKESVIASKVIVTPADANLSHLCWVYYIRSKLT